LIIKYKEFNEYEKFKDLFTGPLAFCNLMVLATAPHQKQDKLYIFSMKKSSNDFQRGAALQAPNLWL
jgi:hypothetical protein